jgi:hypothetical protein
VSKEQIAQKTRCGVANTKYELRVDDKVYSGLSEVEVREKLLEIDPERKLQSSDFRVREIGS